jgi:uncharacterized protein (TIGR02466 family)
VTAAKSDGRAGGRVSLLFATPVVLGEFDPAEELNAALEQRILAKREDDKGLKLSNRGGWQSTHDFVRWSGAAGVTVIKRACELASAHVSRPDGTPVRWTVDAWANVSGPGAFNMPHVHGGTYWAAVYYVRVGEGDGGQLVLHDPRMPGLRMHAPGIRFSNMGPDVRAEIRPKEGLLVMFPGWLSHSVEPWLGSGERISVAMNIRAVG